MKRILLTATVPGHIETFHIPLAQALSGRGWVVDTASNGLVNDPSIAASYLVDWTRSPLSFGNIRSARQLKEILKNGGYDLVYCHTPVAAAITRLAARSSRAHGTRVAYMGHGFHFFRGAPLSYWLTFFPAEWVLSFLTDDILTINREDFERARRWFHANVHRTSGVGIDLGRFSSKGYAEPNQLRAETGISTESKVIMFVGEISTGKNQELLIRALSKLDVGNTQTDLVLVGDGPARPRLEQLTADVGLTNRVHFLGRRSNVSDLLAEADLVASASVREGLPQNVVEAMAMGKPVLASPIRGHVDLIEHGVNGFLTQSFDPEEWALAIKHILSHPKLAARVGRKASERAQDFEVSKAVAEVVTILDR